MNLFTTLPTTSNAKKTHNSTLRSTFAICGRVRKRASMRKYTHPPKFYIGCQLIHLNFMLCGPQSQADFTNSLLVSKQTLTVWFCFPQARRERSRSPTPGKYLGSDRLRRAINRPVPPPMYNYPYRASYRPYPPPLPYGGYPYPSRGYPDRYSPDRRRDRSPMRSPPRRYSPPPYRGRESPIRGRAPYGYSSREVHRDRSRSREREYHRQGYVRLGSGLYLFVFVQFVQ